MRFSRTEYRTFEGMELLSISKVLPTEAENKLLTAALVLPKHRKYVEIISTYNLGKEMLLEDHILKFFWTSFIKKSSELVVNKLAEIISPETSTDLDCEVANFQITNEILDKFLDTDQPLLC